MQLIVQYKGQTAHACAGLSACAAQELAARYTAWFGKLLGDALRVRLVPEEGDRFVSDGLDVTVTKVDHRRVLEIRVEVLPEETDNKK